MEPKNRLLRALPRPELEAIGQLLEHVTLRPRLVLHHAGLPVDSIYFIEEGLVSVSARTTPRTSVEAWLTGSDGMVGLPAIFGPPLISPHRRIVQVGGSAFRMSAESAHQLLDSSKPFRDVVLAFTHVALIRSAQFGACNTHHTVRQRLARWLLMASDSLDSADLPLTTQVLAALLGIRRASASECITELGKQNLVVKRRGSIHIVNRQALSETACDCYDIARREYDRVIPR
jgi:CRP-like cAMP-binding protein